MRIFFFFGGGEGLESRLLMIFSMLTSFGMNRTHIPNRRTAS